MQKLRSLADNKQLVSATSGKLSNYDAPAIDGETTGFHGSSQDKAARAGCDARTHVRNQVEPAISSTPDALLHEKKADLEGPPTALHKSIEIASEARKPYDVLFGSLSLALGASHPASHTITQILYDIIDIPELISEVEAGDHKRNTKIRRGEQEGSV